MTLVTTFVQLVQRMSAGAMTVPTRSRLLMLLAGWVFSGRRTVTGMLVASGAAGQRHHAGFHRVFSAARWSLDALGLALFALLQPLLAPGQPVPLTLDDTLARKRGLKVYGVGMHHDPLASSRKLPVTSWGHSWVVLAVRVQLPCVPGRYFSLPVLFRLYLNKKAAARWRIAYRTRPELAVQLLETLCKAHPQRRFHAYADSAYGGQSVLRYLPANCDLTSRMPLDARLYAAPPARKPGTPGRPRKRGARLPTPAQMLEGRARHTTLKIYGRQDRVRLCECVARWYSVPGRPLKVVAVEPLRGGRPVQAFYSTCSEETAVEVLTQYAGRWSIEETFQGGKSHLGFEEPQGWTKRAVLRTAPCALLLYSLVVLWFAQEGNAAYAPPCRPWYAHKARPSFLDMLQTLRRESLRAEVFAQLPSAREREKPAEYLIDAVLAAA
ncbi:transposase [Aggregicoccus sp. 17bor-14]|uniref:IS701 family transposase n=1 Tax=Myxococcaceae TaxID=31 RepID=UPI00129CE3C9|nr:MULTISPECIES: transposase [Myxococcaceae]MBF5046663.1 transposase [Simulacricoccus sp. 17bor-14]MRI92372.1 transposase [Aggregicoccus sp. 17bor-14]